MDCNHQYFGPYNQNSYASWSTSNSSALTVSGAGNITANDYGQSWLFADWDDYYWFSDSEGCWSDVEPLEAAALVQVRKPKWAQLEYDDPNATYLCPFSPPNAVEHDRTYGFYDNSGKIYDSSMRHELVESFTSQAHCDVGLDNQVNSGYQLEDNIATCVANCTATVIQSFMAGGPLGALSSIPVKNCSGCTGHTGYTLTITKQGTSVADR